MTGMGWRTSVALVAGLLTFAGGRALAENRDEMIDPAPRGSSSGAATTTHGSTAASTHVGGTPSSESSHLNEITGRIESFDRTQNTLTLSGKELKVDSSTEVLRDGTRASISDIKEGDQVRASFSGSGDTSAAQRLEVMTQGASGAGSTAGSGSGVGPGSMGGSSGSQGASGTSSAPSSGSGMSTGPSSSSGAGSSEDAGKAKSAKQKDAKNKRSNAKQQDAKSGAASGSETTDVQSDTANTTGGGK